MECLLVGDGMNKIRYRESSIRGPVSYQGLRPDSTLKTKHMVTGREAADSDKTPIPVSDNKTVGVQDISYLGSTIAASDRMDADAERLL